MMFFYHMLWTGICFPWLFGAAMVKRGRLAHRLALDLPLSVPGPENIWVHALSVGEVISAIPLVERLRQTYPGYGVVFTVTTDQGMKLANCELKQKVHALLRMPFDFWWSIRRVVEYIRPKVFILVETDIWPALPQYLARKGIRSLLVNGRISPSTFESYRKFPYFSKTLFNNLYKCLMQSDLDTNRLLKIGVPQERVQTTGNIKFDRQWTPMGRDERSRWLELFGFKEENIIWVAGSTHGEESDIILKAFARLKQDYPLLRLIIAPRRIEEADRIKQAGSALGLRMTLRTRIKEKASAEVIVLDTIGELERIYGLGEISFVGGSMIPKGGHNLLEPASFGSPVLFGPYTENFVFMSEALINSGGGIRVKDGEHLFAAMAGLLREPEHIKEKGRLAREFVYSNQGALDMVMAHVDKCIHKTGAGL